MAATLFDLGRRGEPRNYARSRTPATGASFELRPAGDPGAPTDLAA
jgi:hypothetical protein